MKINNEKKNITDPKEKNEDILAIFGSLPPKETTNKDWKQIRKEAKVELIFKKQKRRL